MDERTVGRKGQWVEIHRIVLPAGQRAPQVPEETQRVPLEMRTKGFLDADARIGEQVTVTTVIGRKVAGTLINIEPCYKHDFGGHVGELATIGPELRSILRQFGEEETDNGRWQR